MKSLVIFALLSILVLTGCAYPSYHRGYAGYGSSYSSGYDVHTYSTYPGAVYYRQQTVVPSYSYRYSPPRHDHGPRHHDRDWGNNRHDWNRNSQNRPRVERNIADMRGPGPGRWSVPNISGDRDGFRQRMQQQPGSGRLRMEGGGDRSGDFGARREADSGRRNNHREGGR
ncbi:hypothetical protein NP590_08185 [Methylomonas sp. SURF-2]|uniref:Lipoprotein n=1 Tax=Methylomonas subterranea TaxID=2952225 RepID=A0ABT1TF35_9GAMM|nr:hypothetical protein [Methylomonas sp. SURF-2]MCQ8104078.1 hypothetical protein [Methylomonas sp. SURF-2]